VKAVKATGDPGEIEGKSENSFAARKAQLQNYLQGYHRSALSMGFRT
jgi:hypothetical protein